MFKNLSFEDLMVDSFLIISCGFLFTVITYPIYDAYRRSNKPHDALCVETFTPFSVNKETTCQLNQRIYVSEQGVSCKCEY